MNDCKKYKSLSVFFGCIILFLLIYISFKQVENYNRKNDPMINHIKRVLKPIIPEINDINIYASDRSFTINKKDIYLCLRKKSGEYYPLNMLIYVVAHEYSHRITTSIGHTEEFYKNFDKIQKKLELHGIFTTDIPIDESYSME